MDDPYAPPITEPDHGSVQPSPPIQGQMLAQVGLFLYAGPMMGIIVATLAVLRLFNVLANEAASDPEALSQELSVVLLIILTGIVMGVIGVVFLSVAFFRKGYRSPVCFWVTLLLSIVYCFLVFPIGTVISGAMIVALLIKRKEFISPR